MNITRLHHAARQFEALVARQLVREMQPEEGDALFGMAQEQLADAIADSGALGFSSLLEKALGNQARERGSTSSSGSSQLK